MLGFVEGTIVSRNEETGACTVACGGVGYEISVPASVLLTLALDSSTRLWLHTHVREDVLHLYGFTSENERGFFRILLGVSGLGPKTALALLSEHGAARLAALIRDKNTVGISKASGVGKKLAARLVLELGAKAERLAWLSPAPASQPASAPHPGRGMYEDLHSALEHLGYNTGQIDRTLERLFDSGSVGNFETGLRQALAEISGRGARGAEEGVVK